MPHKYFSISEISIEGSYDRFCKFFSALISSPMHMNTPISPLVYSSNFGMNLKQVTFIKKINENL